MGDFNFLPLSYPRLYLYAPLYAAVYAMDEKVEMQLVVVAEEEEILVVAVMVVVTAVVMEVVVAVVVMVVAAFKSCYRTLFGIRE